VRYATTLRPVPHGGIPPALRWEWAEAPQDGRTYYRDGKALKPSRYRYGVFEPERDLTPEEMAHFDIVLVGP
jgi:hypothetical protein